MSAKYIYISLITLCSIFLTGCWSSQPEWPIVIFDTPLQIQIEDWYTQVSPGIVENKQITNKVLKAYKKANEDDPADFQDNIVITKSEFTEPLDYDQFRSVNQRLMMNGLVGYQPWTLERTSFECKEQRISMLIVNFAVQWDILQHFAQAQFVHNDIWYIVSFASTDIDTRDDVLKWIWLVNCGESDDS